MNIAAAFLVAILLVGSAVEPAARRYAAAYSVNPYSNAPRFEDFPVTEKFKGKPAIVRLLSRESRRYRTMIRDGALEGPKFRGQLHDC